MSPSCHQVISGQQLPKVNNKKSSIVDALVKVEVYGVPADVAEKETHPVEDNGTFLVLYIYLSMQFTKSRCLFCIYLNLLEVLMFLTLAVLLLPENSQCNFLFSSQLQCS